MCAFAKTLYFEFVCLIWIAVETHHFVTQVIVILVKNVTSVTTELMAPVGRAETGFPPRKMAPAVNLMKVDKVTHN